MYLSLPILLLGIFLGEVNEERNEGDQVSANGIFSTNLTRIIIKIKGLQSFANDKHEEVKKKAVK